MGYSLSVRNICFAFALCCSSQLRPTVLRPCHRNTASPLPSFLPLSLIRSFSLVSLNHKHAVVCAQTSFRPPVGQAGSALQPGCCWRSSQVFGHSPSLTGQDCPSVTRDPPCPRTPAPSQLHTHTQKSWVYGSYFKKGQQFANRPTV